MKYRTLIILIYVLFTTVSHSQPDTVSKYVSAGPEDFLTLMRSGENTVLIDVRLPFEHRKERIEESKNIPTGKNFIRKMSVIPVSSTILLYCTTGVRSMRAAERLYDAGYRKLYNLEGGIEAWKSKSLPVKGR